MSAIYQALGRILGTSRVTTFVAKSQLRIEDRILKFAFYVFTNFLKGFSLECDRSQIEKKKTINIWIIG